MPRPTKWATKGSNFKEDEAWPLLEFFLYVSRVIKQDNPRRILFNCPFTGNVPAVARVPGHPPGAEPALRHLRLQDQAELQRGPVGPLFDSPHHPRV